MLSAWGSEGWDQPHGEHPHEAVLLKLDCSKARSELGWRPVLRLEDSLTKTVEWHREVAVAGDARVISLNQLKGYRDVRSSGLASQGQSA